MSKSNQPGTDHRESGFSSGLLWGLVLGIFGTFLFTTEEGKKIRDYLSRNRQKLSALLDEISQETEEAEIYSEMDNDYPGSFSPDPEIGKTGAEPPESEDKKTNRSAKPSVRQGFVSKHFFSRSGKALK